MSPVAAPWASTHLDRSPSSILEVARDSLGLYVAPPVSHLELAARLPGYRTDELERLLLDRKAIGLRTLRGSAFLIPVDLLSVVVPATRAKNVRAFGGYVRKILVTDTYETWAHRIDELLAGGEALTKVEIKERLDPSDGDLRALNFVVSQMATESRLVGLRRFSSWRSAQIAYTRWRDWLPEVDVETPDPGDARRELARMYFRSFGPATIDDFAWWSGLTKTQARRAVEEGAIPASGEAMFGLEREVSSPAGVRLLPIWDTLFVTWRDRSRIIPDALLPFVYDSSGNATSVVLVDGVVAGVWSLGGDDDLEILAAPFDSFTPGQWEEIEAEGQIVARLAGKDSARLVRRSDPPDLVAGKRNLFMRPLS